MQSVRVACLSSSLERGIASSWLRRALGASLVALLAAPAFAAAPDAVAQAQEAWRDTIAHTPAPAGGCFTAAYPATTWSRVECVAAPEKAYLPRGLAAQTVGNGNDYEAQVTGLVSNAVGTFPTVTGVKGEKDGSKNVYSLQLNSNFMNTSVCDGHPNCQSWQQFVYSSSEKSVFMQYWMINYTSGLHCPSGGWHWLLGSCWMNSAAVAAPQIPITDLSALKISGTAVNGGLDTMVFTAGTQAFSTTGEDSKLGLATGWNGGEFNVIGDGGGSAASFNKGSSITVKLAITNGTTEVPVCAAGAGTTGETNNLNLGACTATGGAQPAIQFVESN